MIFARLVLFELGEKLSRIDGKYTDPFKHRFIKTFGDNPSADSGVNGSAE